MRAMMRAHRLFHCGGRPLAVCSRSRAASIVSASPQRHSSSSPQGAQSTAPQKHQQDKRPADVFRRAKRGSFFQAMPQLQNPFLEDPFLRGYLTRVMPAEVGGRCRLDLAQPCSLQLLQSYFLSSELYFPWCTTTNSALCA